jgi:uncharacterized alpha-E superfamily protein
MALDMEEIVYTVAPIKGPQRDEVVMLLADARRLTPVEAQLLEVAWGPEISQDDWIHYMAECGLVMQALRATDRKLPPSWLEHLFSDMPWIHETKALDAVADAVNATLVRDVIPRPTYEMLTSAWREIQGHRKA